MILIILSQGDIEELISAKLEKEANRYIQQWEKEKISIENGRWGAFINLEKQCSKFLKKRTEASLKRRI
jgi:DNA topoisomerase-1